MIISRSYQVMLWVSAVAMIVSIHPVFGQQTEAIPSLAAQVYKKIETTDEYIRWQKTQMTELRNAATNGNATAQLILARKLYNGQDVTKDEAEATKWFALSAEQGIAEAQSAFGWLCQHGHGVAQDYEAAAKWTQLAAEQGLASAQFQLGQILSMERSKYSATFQGNYPVAAEWFARAAEQGHIEAMHELARLFTYGKLPDDYPQAVQWLKKAAEKNDLKAILRLGEIHRTNNRSLLADHKESLRWYLLAAEKGNPTAQYEAAMLLLEGDAIPHDAIAAKNWLKKAASADYASAIIQLDLMTNNYDFERTAREISIPTLQRAVHREQNDRNKLLLGIAFEKGFGVAVNLDGALKQYTDVAYPHHPVSAEATRRLIKLLHSMDHVKLESMKIGEEILLWSRKELNTPELLYQTGDLFRFGKGFRANLPLAVDFYTEAAQKGSAAAINRLGELWTEGIDGEPDLVEAAGWYRRAASQGLDLAQYNLGMAYVKGAGVETNVVEAWKWLHLAAKQNHPLAQKQVPELEQQMTPAQINEAKQLAAKPL